MALHCVFYMSIVLQKVVIFTLISSKFHLNRSIELYPYLYLFVKEY